MTHPHTRTRPTAPAAMNAAHLGTTGPAPHLVVVRADQLRAVATPDCRTWWPHAPIDCTRLATCGTVTDTPSPGA